MIVAKLHHPCGLDVRQSTRTITIWPAIVVVSQPCADTPEVTRNQQHRSRHVTTSVVACLMLLLSLPLGCARPAEVASPQDARELEPYLGSTTPSGPPEPSAPGMNPGLAKAPAVPEASSRTAPAIAPQAGTATLPSADVVAP